MGEQTTTARVAAALESLARSRCVACKSVSRSYSNVYTALRVTVAKAARTTARLISSSAAGTHCTTSRLPSARSSASSGVMTVVLPPPMIIWQQSDSPPPAFAMKSETSDTWAPRSTKVDANSNASSRGSSVASAPAPPTVACLRPAASAEARPSALTPSSVRASSRTSSDGQPAPPAAFSAAATSPSRSSTCGKQRRAWEMREVRSIAAAHRWRARCASCSPKYGLKWHRAATPCSDIESATSSSNHTLGSRPPVTLSLWLSSSREGGSRGTPLTRPRAASAAACAAPSSATHSCSSALRKARRLEAALVAAVRADGPKRAWTLRGRRQSS
mmetsp:Transcript_2107/g.6930  ORF Transcript_2107/g.6930 Transcript_2107/m.6930 type:complete len:332 (+) Transcript_2107:299-1294(+)